MATEVRRTGRPPKTAAPGTRVSLGLKVTAEMKLKLDDAARETGRTQSQEAERRLELSFAYEKALGEYEPWSKMLSQVVIRPGQQGKYSKSKTLIAFSPTDSSNFLFPRDELEAVVERAVLVALKRAGVFGGDK